MALPKDLNDREHRKFRQDPDNHNQSVIAVTQVNGLIQEKYDYVSMELSAGDTTETYTFKTGGSGGTTVATVTVVYTDSTREVLSSATKT